MRASPRIQGGRTLMTMPTAATATDATTHAPSGVSVVVPTCNRRDQILRCVKSLLAQTLPPTQVIVVDDGSTDGTVEAVQALASSAGATSLIVIRNERNLGANASRNVGIQSATGSLVAFLDSDCIADPHWIERLRAPFVDASVGAASGLVEDTMRSTIWERAFAGTHRLPRRGPVSRFTSCNLMVRRTLLAMHRWEEDFSDATRQGVQPDTTFSGRCDEEGLYLAIREAGWSVVAEPAARVDHEHAYGWSSFCRQAWHGGRAAAELVWKFRLRDRLDLAPFLLAVITLAVTLAVASLIDAAWRWWLPALALAPLAAGCAAVSWNETANKGKTMLGLVSTLPALTVYYALRTSGYGLRRVQLWLGIGAVARIEPGSLGRSLPKPGSGS